jgi:hypothetical protein
MANQFVPASTPIRASRVANIDDDRRHGHLASMFDMPHPWDRRRTFAEKARELHAIENALADRGWTFDRRTVRYTP